MPLLAIFILLLLILANGALALSELALVSARRARLERLAEDGRAGAHAAARLQADPSGFLSTVQIGITLVGVVAGAYSGATLAGPLGELLVGAGSSPGVAGLTATGIVVGVVTYLSLVIGELVPKRVALVNPERAAMIVAPTMTVLATAVAPLVWLLRRSTDAVLRAMRVPEEPETTTSDDDLRALLAEGRRAGTFEPTEAEMIDRLVRVADRPVRSLMTPRLEVVWLEAAADSDAWRHKIAAHRHTRYPVCSGALDEVVGVLHVRELACALLAGGAPDLRALAQPALMIPEGTPVVRLVEMIRQTPMHMAVVLDEYGNVEGIVTPSDILRAIAGGMPEDRPVETPEAVQRPDGSWLVDGRIDVLQAERLLHVRGMASDDYATLAGFVLWRMRRVPRTGDGFEWNGLAFEVVDLDGNRIDKVLIRKLEA